MHVVMVQLQRACILKVWEGSLTPASTCPQRIKNIKPMLTLLATSSPAGLFDIKMMPESDSLFLPGCCDLHFDLSISVLQLGSGNVNSSGPYLRLMTLSRGKFKIFWSLHSL